ncbi:MAG: UDP-2,3-diacylglucosamine diphosphatase [Proteobacteria bacterium]|nr:UDP-2,3-diacylglucosamine diphosphatase [Pseudomonadota bacterium]
MSSSPRLKSYSNQNNGASSASDLHLSAGHTQSMAAFLHFTATTAPQAEALYILGDLFEYWAGDDDLHDPFHQRVIIALRSLSAQNTRLYLMHGNRDLLMGEALAGACSATLLTDPTLIDLYGTPTLLSHGDTLCTDDIEYQNFRKNIQSIDFKQQFLSKPLAERKTWIEQLRRHSDTEKRSKDSAIMDVNDDAVACLLRKYCYPRLIHGHTHRPDRHEHTVDGHRCERWVLGDWDSRANALRVDARSIKWVTIPN